MRQTLAGAAYAFTDVNVVAMDRPEILVARTVLVEDGSIVAIAAPGEIPLRDTVARIQGAGRFLIPGLADMHVHIAAEIPGTGVLPPDALTAPLAGLEWEESIRKELRLYPAHGVTTVRNMGGSPTTLEWSNRIETERIPAPRIFSASPIIDGNPPSNPAGGAHLLERAADARALVQKIRRDGYRFVKVYNTLTPEVYRALVNEARSEGLPVIGHVPFQVGLSGALAARQDSIEHLRGYDFAPCCVPTETLSTERFLGWLRVTDEMMHSYARETAAAGIWNCPTLVINSDGMMSGTEKLTRLARPQMQDIPTPLREFMSREVFPPEIRAAIYSTVSQQLKMVRILNEHGAKLLAGTDSPLLGTVPGYDLHRELEFLVSSGLSPFDALKTATVNAQEFLQESARRGRICVGYDADLTLIDGNPLCDITNTRRVAGVMLRGTWYSQEDLK